MTANEDTIGHSAGYWRRVANTALGQLSLAQLEIDALRDRIAKLEGKMVESAEFSSDASLNQVEAA